MNWRSLPRSRVVEGCCRDRRGANRPAASRAARGRAARGQAGGVASAVRLDLACRWRRRVRPARRSACSRAAASWCWISRLAPACRPAPAAANAGEIRIGRGRCGVGGDPGGSPRGDRRQSTQAERQPDAANAAFGLRPRGRLRGIGGLATYTGAHRPSVGIPAGLRRLRRRARHGPGARVTHGPGPRSGMIGIEMAEQQQVAPGATSPTRWWRSWARSPSAAASWSRISSRARATSRASATGWTAPLGGAFLEMLSRVMSQPHELAQAQFGLWQDYVRLWHSTTQRMLGRRRRAGDRARPRRPPVQGRGLERQRPVRLHQAVLPLQLQVLPAGRQARRTG